MRCPLTALALAAALTGCAFPGPEASFGATAAAHTGTFVGATVVLLAMPVLIPTAIMYSLVTRTPLICSEPVARPVVPVAGQEIIEAPRTER